MKWKVFITGDGKDTQVVIYFLESPKAMREGAGNAPFRKSRGDAMNCFCNISVSSLEPHRYTPSQENSLWSMVLLQTPKKPFKEETCFSHITHTHTRMWAANMKPMGVLYLFGLVGLRWGVSHLPFRWKIGGVLHHHLRQVTVVLPVFQRSVPEWLGLVELTDRSWFMDSTRGAPYDR